MTELQRRVDGGLCGLKSGKMICDRERYRLFNLLSCEFQSIGCLKQKILIIELWGLGDLTFSTPFIREAAKHYEVHILGKSYARELLHPSYPALEFTSFDAPWTAFVGKFNLWQWKWRELYRMVRKLRAKKFDIAVSIRKDPRDHLLMWLLGARQRYGCPRLHSGIFLTHQLHCENIRQHKVDDWRDFGRQIGLEHMGDTGPSLRHEGYRSYRVERVLEKIDKPIVCLHTGARMPLRRWPAEHFAEIIRRLRDLYDFHLMLIPDPDGYGESLGPLSNSILRNLTVRELVSVLGSSDLVLCNDSGPSHIAAECKRPVISFFGPGDTVWFRPWGEHNKIIVRDLCPERPCFDYCKFPEPLCLTKLMPEEVWPEIREHIEGLVRSGVVHLQPRKL